MSFNFNISKNNENLLNLLQRLLENQIAAIKNNDFRGIESAMEQADSMICEIEKTPEFGLKSEYENLINLYKKLQLMIEGEKKSIDKQLLKIARGKKIARTYNY